MVTVLTNRPSDSSSSIAKMPNAPQASPINWLRSLLSSSPFMGPIINIALCVRKRRVEERDYRLMFVRCLKSPQKALCMRLKIKVRPVIPSAVKNPFRSQSLNPPYGFFTALGMTIEVGTLTTHHSSLITHRCPQAEEHCLGDLLACLSYEGADDTISLDYEHADIADPCVALYVAVRASSPVDTMST